MVASGPALISLAAVNLSYKLLSGLSLLLSLSQSRKSPYAQGSPTPLQIPPAPQLLKPRKRHVQLTSPLYVFDRVGFLIKQVQVKISRYPC